MVYTCSWFLTLNNTSHCSFSTYMQCFNCYRAFNHSPTPIINNAASTHLISCVNDNICKNIAKGRTASQTITVISTEFGQLSFMYASTSQRVPFP